MAQFVGMGMIFFDGPASGENDAWAESQAQWLKDNTEVLAAQARLVNPGTAAERSSYFGAFKVEANGTLTEVSAWHLDAQGVVQQGMPQTPVPDTGGGETYPAWEVWSGNNADLYQSGDRVTHNGADWEATANNNHWEPGVFGWVQL